jgi:hypothetical protein
MEPEEEPRTGRETPRRMAGHGSAGASPYRQGVGHGQAWIMGLFRGKPSELLCLGRNADGARTSQEAKVRASWNSGPTDGHSYGRSLLRTVTPTDGHSYGRSCGRSPGKPGLRAWPDIRFWVTQAAGLYRSATRRAGRGSCPKPIRTGLLQEGASIFRSTGRRPARAGRPCYPFSGHALRALPAALRLFTYA